jgi:hypothetical protein
MADQPKELEIEWSECFSARMTAKMSEYQTASQVKLEPLCTRLLIPDNLALQSLLKKMRKTGPSGSSTTTTSNQ